MKFKILKTFLGLANSGFRIFLLICNILLKLGY